VSPAAPTRTSPTTQTTQPQTVLVTGAGTGMGALSSISLAQAGHRVFASMRDPEGRKGPGAARPDQGRARRTPGPACR
jgi:NAD(P)-dependent dehydrogenase (short-subunit alcohol dehydrogenase family)